MNQDIVFDVIGNTSPFSLMGESSGYMITVNGHSYLLDCGSPVFPSLGYKGIAEIKGIFATHSHEDHKRWFTDIVLFTFYNPLYNHKVNLISSEPVLEEFSKNSKGALERSLSHDAKRIVDVPYDLMVDEVLIGPRSRYYIDLVDNCDGSYQYEVKDRQGHRIGPEKAKIVINPKANRPRLLLKDDQSSEWVEPASYYPFTCKTFYEENDNIFRDEDVGLTVKAIKASVWHGVPTIGFKFITESNTLLFSADTVYKPSLWKELCEQYRPQNFDSISREKFNESSIIYGDINDFIERTWSYERYEIARSAYRDAAVVHDVARKKSIVHTDYPDIATAHIKNLLFTHNPDNLTARRPILKSGKRIVFRDGKVFEWVKGEIYPLDADVYIRHFNVDMVGYQSENGSHVVVEEDGLLGVVEADQTHEGLLRVNLYQDIGGEYFPAVLNDPHRSYGLREDGKVELIQFDESSSRGRVVENIRAKIKKSCDEE
jgi:ribonuclease BN (tRNA processing enzyme)